MGYSESDMLCPFYKRDEHTKHGRVIICEIAKITIYDREMMKDIGYTLCANLEAYCPFREALKSFYDRKKEPGD